MASDDDLILAAINAACEPHQHHDTLVGMSPAYVAQQRRIVRAVRVALEPPVTPLAPGETVTIPDLWGYPQPIELVRAAEFDALRIGGMQMFDAAGVAQLIAAARRWQAAQGERQ